jgi:pyruvate kinase
MQPNLNQRRWARTKIIATVGPASSSPEKLAELAEAGVDVFRLNMAHGDPTTAQTLVDRIRQVSRDQGRPIAILVDLAGPKIRLGEVASGWIQCDLDATFTIVAREPRDTHELTVTYEPLLRELEPGDTVMLADGLVAMMRGVMGRPARFSYQTEETYTVIYFCPVPGCAETAEVQLAMTQIPVQGAAPRRPDYARRD